MKKTTNEIYEELFLRYPILCPIKEQIKGAFDILVSTYKNGGTLFVCGNGGSASDSEHIVGELLKSFKKPRPVDKKTAKALKNLGERGEYILSNLEGALPAVSLISQSAIVTAFANDRSWDTAMAQQLYGLSKSGDCLIAISTSGNSKNCVYAALLAKAKGLKTIAFAGVGGGELLRVCDECIAVPEKETYKVQELHLPIYHCLCAMLEEEFFD